MIMFALFCSTRVVDTAHAALRFEHYMHPCLNTSTKNVSVSRFFLPFGQQGFEVYVRNWRFQRHGYALACIVHILYCRLNMHDCRVQVVFTIQCFALNVIILSLLFNSVVSSVIINVDVMNHNLVCSKVLIETTRGAHIIEPISGIFTRQNLTLSDPPLLSINCTSNCGELQNIKGNLNISVSDTYLLRRLSATQYVALLMKSKFLYRICARLKHNVTG